MALARRAWLVAFAFALASAGRARAAPDPTYAALRAAAPRGPAIAVTSLVIERDVFRFRFERGAFQFLAPVDGRVTGAVFVGTGTWELHPATEGERQHLALLTGDKGLEVLGDRFETLVLLFTDDTEADIRRAGAEAGVASERGLKAWEAYRRAERKEVKANFEVRILEDILGRTDSSNGVFLAFSDGGRVPRWVAAVDPAGLEWLAPGMMTGSEDSALYVVPEQDAGFWYLSRRKSELAAPREIPEPFRAEHYEIDSRIEDNTRLSGTTTIRGQATSPGRRVVPLHLMDRLRIQEAAISFEDGASWEPAATIQEKEDEDADPAVILPRAPHPGTSWLLRLRYAGKEVLLKRGDGNFAVEARESWYPNLGTFRSLASFDLTYRVPKGTEVVSVGERVDDKTVGDLQISVWKARRPIRVAGFNYGTFRKIEKDDPDSGLKIEVYTNPGTPDLVREINAALQSRSDTAAEQSMRVGAGLRSLNLDPSAFADAAMADGLNAARVGTAYFGPLEERHVAITQQAQWFFGQSWPSLVFLPYLAVLDGTQRRELGLGGGDTTDFVDLVGPHELAHQWWGHQIGWSCYRDTWLSEGFAEFSAALVLQRVSGSQRVNEFWDRARRTILEKPRTGSMPNADAGPITLGLRLATRKTPGAYAALVYEKGAYVLQMLRMLMFDPRTRPPDAGFIAMMKDFADSYAGKNPTTRDFQTVVERHLTPTMDLTHDGKMDWFFRQWLDGTEIPRYDVKVGIQSTGADQYTLSGSIAQADVSPNFHGFLPLYIEFEKGELMRLAVVTFTGPETVPIATTLKLPKKPVRIVANAMRDVLTR